MLRSLPLPGFRPLFSHPERRFSVACSRVRLVCYPACCHSLQHNLLHATQKMRLRGLWTRLSKSAVATKPARYATALSKAKPASPLQGRIGGFEFSQASMIASLENVHGDIAAACYLSHPTGNTKRGISVSLFLALVKLSFAQMD